MWAYPVAGSQRAFGAMLTVLVLVLIVADGAVDFAATLKRGLVLTRLRVTRRVFQVSVIGVLLLGVAAEERSARGNLRLGRALELPGARNVRLEPSLVEELRTVTEILRRNADTFVSVPGLNSFYLWTGIEPPTGQNVTNWMALLDKPRQERVIRAISCKKKACVIVAPRALDIWDLNTALRKMAETSPLMSYLIEEFQFVQQVGRYVILARTGRVSPSVRADSDSRARPDAGIQTAATR
jgi:hypothetical protein